MWRKHGDKVGRNLSAVCLNPAGTIGHSSAVCAPLTAPAGAPAGGGVGEPLAGVGKEWWDKKIAER